MPTDSAALPTDDVHAPLLANMDMDEPVTSHPPMDANGSYQPPSLDLALDTISPPDQPSQRSLDHASSGFEAHVRAYMSDRLQAHDSCGASDAMSEPPPSLQAGPPVALAETARSMAGSPVPATRSRFRSAERLSWQRGSAGGGGVSEEDGSKRKTAFKSIPSATKGAGVCMYT